MKKQYFYVISVLMVLFGLSSCSGDDDYGDSDICHAWYWNDEMPKNYTALTVFNPDGTVYSVKMIPTEDGVKKIVSATTTYTLNGNMLTIWRKNPQYGDYYAEGTTYRIFFEKTEEGITMKQYRDYADSASPSPRVLYSTPALDEQYRNAPEYEGGVYNK